MKRSGSNPAPTGPRPAPPPNPPKPSTAAPVLGVVYMSTADARKLGWVSVAALEALVANLRFCADDTATVGAPEGFDMAADKLEALIKGEQYDS